MSDKKKNLLVVGLDIGTTYSGYAYSFNQEYHRDPLKISVSRWDKSRNFYKIPTVILFPRSCTDRNDIYFGENAEKKYADLGLDKQSENWLLFRVFKMKLYYEKNLSRATKLESVCAEHHEALDVFSKAISYFTKHFMDSITLEVPAITMDEVNWVITVPAIWNDNAKQFMLEAALEAGIEKEHLILALEPEASSLYCRILPVDKNKVVGNKITAYQPGTKYMTVDIGGGTVDVTVHQIESDGRLKEIYQASGGDWGGTKVDENFITKLHEYFGQKKYEEFARECPAELLDLHRSFELAKRTGFASPQSEWISIYIPFGLRNKVDGNSESSEFHWIGDKIRMKKDVFEKLFESSIQDIINHLRDVFKNTALENLTGMFLVGGYSECQILQDAIKHVFQDRVQAIHVPRDAGLAVMLGAVLYGHDQSMICQRISRVTYGIKSNTKFDPKIHHLSKKKVVNGKEICKDIFDIFLQVGKAYECGQEITKVFYPLKSDQRFVECDVYTSPNADVQYVTDPGCEMIGSLRLTTLYATSGTDSPIDVTFRVGGTYLEVLVQDRNAKTIEALFDFLSRA